MKTCQRCGAELYADFCTDETCPFSHHLPGCPNGWHGHPRNTLVDPIACDCWLTLQHVKPALAKTIVKVEILHPPDDDVSGCSLEQIYNESMNGGWSMVSSIEEVVPLTKEKAIVECDNQGTDPSFFFLDDEEEEEDEDETSDAVIELERAAKRCLRAGVDPEDAFHEMSKRIREEVEEES